MKSKKTTRRALLSSVIALLLCVSMLVGSTFAWFTDSVTSQNNIIKSGNLDVTLEYWNKDEGKYVEVTSQTELFNSAALWEPGYTEVAYLKIGNAGSLALKYQLGVNVVEETTGQTKAGDVIKLSDHLVFSVEEKQIGSNADLYTREDAMEAAGSTKGLKDYNSGTKTLEAKNAEGNNDYADYVALIIYMPTSVGNEANHDGTKVPTINLGVNLVATQVENESDSFGKDYDKDAQYPSVVVNSIDDLISEFAKAAPGDSFTLAAGEYTVNEPLVIPSGVTLFGAQAGVPAAQWVNDPSAEKTVIVASSGNAVEIVQTSDDLAEAVSNIVIDGIMIDGNGTGNNGIYVKKSGGEALEGVKVLNCAVVNSKNNGINVRNTYGAVIEGNYVKNVKDTAICLGNYNGYHYETWKEVTAYVRNNVIEDVTATVNGAIYLENGMGDVVVSGNVIKNVASGSARTPAAGISVYDVYEGGVIVIEDNTIENVDRGIGIYKYSYSTVYSESWWEGPKTDNDGVVIRKNIIKDFTVFGISTDKLNNEGTSDPAVVEITDNQIVSTVVSNALLVQDNSAGWNVTASGNSLNGAVVDAVNGTFAK